MGVVQATGPLTDLSRGVTDFAAMFGGERGGGPITDSMQARGLATELYTGLQCVCVAMHCKAIWWAVRPPLPFHRTRRCSDTVVVRLRERAACSAPFSTRVRRTACL